MPTRECLDTSNERLTIDAKMIEDSATLPRLGGFVAADARHITDTAFGRRIPALEA